MNGTVNINRPYLLWNRSQSIESPQEFQDFRVNHEQATNSSAAWKLSAAWESPSARASGRQSSAAWETSPGAHAERSSARAEQAAVASASFDSRAEPTVCSVECRVGNKSRRLRKEIERESSQLRLVHRDRCTVEPGHRVGSGIYSEKIVQKDLDRVLDHSYLRRWNLSKRP